MSSSEDPAAFQTDFVAIAKSIYRHMSGGPTTTTTPYPYAALSQRHLFFVNPSVVLDAPLDVLDKLATYEAATTIPHTAYDLARSALLLQKDATVTVFGPPRSGVTTMVRTMLKFLAVSGCIDVTDEQRVTCGGMVTDLIKFIPLLEGLLTPCGVTLGYTLTLEMEYCSLVSYDVIVTRIVGPPTGEPLENLEVWRTLGASEADIARLTAAAKDAAGQPAQLAAIALHMLRGITKSKERVDALATYRITLVEGSSANGDVAAQSYTPTDISVAPHPLAQSSHVLMCATAFPPGAGQGRSDGVRCDMQHVLAQLITAVDLFGIPARVVAAEERHRHLYDVAFVAHAVQCVEGIEGLPRRVIIDSEALDYAATLRERYLTLQCQCLLDSLSRTRTTLTAVMAKSFNVIVRGFYALPLVRLQDGVACHKGECEVLARGRVVAQHVEALVGIYGHAQTEYYDVRMLEMQGWDKEYRGLVATQREGYVRRMRYVYLEEAKHVVVATLEAMGREAMNGKQGVAWRYLVMAYLTEPYVTQSLKELEQKETLDRYGWRGIGGLYVEEAKQRSQLCGVIKGAKAVMIPAGEMEHRMVVEGEQEMERVAEVERFRRRVMRVEDRATISLRESMRRDALCAEEEAFYHAWHTPHLARSFLMIQRDLEPRARNSIVVAYGLRQHDTVCQWYALAVAREEETMRRYVSSTIWLELVALYSREDVMFHEVKERTERGFIPVHRPHARIVAEESVDMLAAFSSGYNPIQRGLMKYFTQKQEMDTQTVMDPDEELLAAHEHMLQMAHVAAGRPQQTVYGQMLSAAQRKPSLYFTK